MSQIAAVNSDVTARWSRDVRHARVYPDDRLWSAYYFVSDEMTCRKVLDVVVPQLGKQAVWEAP